MRIIAYMQLGGDLLGAALQTQQGTGLLAYPSLNGWSVTTVLHMLTYSLIFFLQLIPSVLCTLTHFDFKTLKHRSMLAKLLPTYHLTRR